MSLDVTRKIRGYLISSSSVTTYVNSSDIKVGWVKTEDSFPCITINQVTGIDYGYLGYGTSAAGSKMRREEVNLQIDIYSKTSRLETLQIADAVVKVLVSGTCRKVSDNEMYDDDLGIYRKIQTYNRIMFHDD
jgi:hypothetical protein